MNDLIDRSALLKRIKSEYCGNCNSDNCAKCRYCEYEVMMEIIEEQPKANNEIADELEQLKAERDAAVADLRSQRCDVCTHKYNGEICADCLIHTDRFEWRGVQNDEP